VVEALTYYGHREKLRLVGKEDALEQLNLAALRIAKEVADETGTLFAGNVCNCTTPRRSHSL
jgi:methionine synthase I (cobalamin-dependent)